MKTNLPLSRSEAEESGSASFDLLQEGVRRWVHRRSWASLRDIQERAIPLVLGGSNDIIVAAPTAAGKTEAAFLPICSSLAADPPPAGVGALYVSPLKALINDQHHRLEPLCEAAGIELHSWHGDVAANRKRQVRERPSGILLITPESIEAMLVNHGTGVRAIFGALRYVVVDELHSFIGSERGRQLQSLLHRIELAARRRVPRIALSATLGDMATAAAFLRPGDGEEVRLIESNDDYRELRVQLRGYLVTAPRAEELDLSESAAIEDVVSGDQLAIAADLYAHLRGKDNLVFANSRGRVERYADLLQRRCERERVPTEFWPHHGNLAKALREDVEQGLRTPTTPTTAICTSTLELGIDVGSVASVAQIGAPFSVAATRQRLGRCGRRPEDPSVLRMYVTEEELEPGARLDQDLRQELVQSIAVVELLVDSWFEPPVDGALHLSTLVQQVLSTIAQHGGARADQIWSALCGSGPFQLDQPAFADLLRALAGADAIQQTDDGDLILGPRGERIVGHYSFYAAFTTPEEYRLVADGDEIGSLPVSFPLSEGEHLIFGGRRWRILSVDDERKTITIAPSKAGRVPIFSGAGGDVHDGVRARMRMVYEDDSTPTFLDAGAERLLGEGRRTYRELALHDRQIVEQGQDAVFFPWVGDRVMTTLALGLTMAGREVVREGAAIVVTETSATDLADQLAAAFVEGKPPDALVLASGARNLKTEKHHRLLDHKLLARDYATARLDVDGAVRAVSRAVGTEG